MEYIPDSIVKSHIGNSFKFLVGIRGKGLYGFDSVDSIKNTYYYDLEKFHFDYNKYIEACNEQIKNLWLNETDATLDFRKIKW